MASAAHIAALPAQPVVERAYRQGCRVRGGEGETFVDFDMAGGAILLGYNCPRVEAAVAEGHARPDDVAAVLSDLLPGSPAVRLVAEESHALPAAVAAARRITGRSRVAIWDAAAGVYGGCDDLAAVIADPFGAPRRGLEEARRQASAAGALLIFDEGASAFRTHARGAQGLAGVTPDLAVFGAAIANGRAIGAVAGPAGLIEAIDPADLTRPRPDAVAAASACLRYLAERPVADRLRRLGDIFAGEIEGLTRLSGAGRVFALTGELCFPAPLFASAPVEGVWLRAMTAAGVVVVGAHAFCAAHDDAALEQLVGAYALALPAMCARGLSQAMAVRGPAVTEFEIFSSPEGQV